MKKERIIPYLIVVVLLLSNVQIAVSQQTHQLKGKVSFPDTGEPINGAVISVSGVAESAKTDSLGVFTISMPSTIGDVEVWYPGFYTWKQPIAGRSFVDVILIPDNKFNYNENLLKPLRGTDNLRDKSTALTNMSKQNFAEGSMTVEQAIYNALPGLRMTMMSGMPGEGAYMNARGVNSFIGSSAPLIVINNVPMFQDLNELYTVNGFSSGILSSLNPNDIQNITYLRGADAAMYGSLGANGVILIETDNAVDMETRVQFIGQYGIANNIATLPVMESSDYKSYISDIALTRYNDPAQVLSVFPFLRDNPNSITRHLYDSETDWQSLMYGPAFITDNMFKIKGGDAIALYDLSLGFLNQEGVMENTNFSRYSTRMNANINISKKLELFTSMSLVYMTGQLQEQGMSMATSPLMTSLAKSPLRNAFREDVYGNQLAEYAPVLDENGNLLSENDMVTNPVALRDLAELNSDVYDIFINGGLSYSLTPNWKLTGMVGFYYNYNRTQVFFPGVTYRAFMPLSDGLARNTVRMGVREAFNLYYNVNTQWNKKLNDMYSVNAMAGWQAVTTRREFDAGIGRNTASDFYQNLKDVESSGREFYGYIDLWNWMNFFGAVNFDINNMVSVGANLTADGSASTGKDATRFMIYPSVNAAWNIKNMPGLRDENFVNTLKLRAEYTQTGNSRYSSMLGQSYYETQTYLDFSGIVRPGIPNTTITPEKTASVNLGLDVGLYKNRIDLTVDVYRNKTTDVILDKTGSAAFGTTYIYDNLAEIQNQGVELGFQAYLFKNKNWDWLVGGTLAMNQNEILSLGGESDKIIELSDGSALINRVGESVYSFYGYKTNGVYATTQEAQADGLTTYSRVPFQAGDVRFVNINGADNIIDDSDRVILGDASPDFFGRFYSSVGYKGFRLTANFAYSYGNDAYNAVRRSFENMSTFSNQLTSVNRRWQREGHVTDMPKAIYGDPRENNRFSDRFVEDASFVKLKELTLSYTFGDDFIPFLHGGTFYASGENLLTLTNYIGLDPEFSYSYNPMHQGFDYGKVAQPMNVKFGVKLQF